jgi:hypothetical protein
VEPTPHQILDIIALAVLCVVFWSLIIKTTNDKWKWLDEVRRWLDR